MVKSAKAALLVLLLAPGSAIPGCGPAATVDAEMSDQTNDVGPASDVPAGAVQVGFESIAGATTQHSNHGDSTRTVIADETAWRSFWQGIVAGVSPQPPVPPIDFTRHMVLAATMGNRSSGGYAIGIDSVFLSGSTLYAVVRSTAPGSDCGVAAVLTAPATAVRVDRRTGPVRFVERSESVACD